MSDQVDNGTAIDSTDSCQEWCAEYRGHIQQTAQCSFYSSATKQLNQQSVNTAHESDHVDEIKRHCIRRIGSWGNDFRCLLLALTVLKLTNPSYEPGIDTTLVAVVSIFFAVMGKKFEKPDTGSTNA
ncbi:hypothetical protein HAPAU_37040 [Halalkalicoccus paucihalophilus]|uniref:Uncharacterized protein n=1 Tax=Halalkalicoccus paucihalophilus TaxID=1008153 RepID=A0A151A9F0_9EURY|nr:hypothetical protein [Halalkalicoccus paucihalophilus]KYH24233.1 hypothetical protein HAPAU_37040 [Halalkalicoccus paucihalophilus]